MTRRTRLLALFAALILPAAAFGENIRGPVVETVVLDSTSKPQQVSVGLEDLVAITFGANSHFIKGIELDISVPPPARQYRDLVALYVYKAVSPTPSSATDLYSATRAGFAVLPATPKAYVNIPLKANAVQLSPETITLSRPISAHDFPLIVTVLPVAKGLPSSVSNSTFEIKISPILEDKGLLSLNVTEGGKPPSFPYNLSIDDQPVTPDSSGYELASGVHHLTITSNHYKEVTKTFGIDRGQTTSIDIPLESLVPQIVFEAPDIAEIFLDGKKLEGVPKKPLKVTEGEHTVIIRVGNYSLTKKFSVQRGKSYKISLFLDILVQEN